MEGLSNPIKFNRGLESSLPVLNNGEPAWSTDSNKLFVGTGVGNVSIGTNKRAIEFDLPISEWQESNVYPEYIFEAFLAIDGVVQSDRVDIAFDVPSTIEALSSRVLPSNEPMTDGAKLFAQTKPSKILSGSILYWNV